MQVLILSVIKVHKLLHGMRKLPFWIGFGIIWLLIILTWWRTIILIWQVFIQWLNIRMNLCVVTVPVFLIILYGMLCKMVQKRIRLNLSTLKHHWCRIWHVWTTIIKASIMWLQVCVMTVLPNWLKDINGEVSSLVHWLGESLKKNLWKILIGWITWNCV